MPDENKEKTPTWVWVFVVSVAGAVTAGLLLDLIRSGIQYRRARMLAEED